MQSLVGNYLIREISPLPSRTRHYGSSTLGRFISDWRTVRTREMDWTGLKLLLEGLEGKRVRKRFSLPSVVTKSL
jgi:hypothetical protein